MAATLGRGAACLLLLNWQRYIDGLAINAISNLRRYIIAGSIIQIAYVSVKMTEIYSLLPWSSQVPLVSSMASFGAEVPGQLGLEELRDLSHGGGTWATDFTLSRQNWVINSLVSCLSAVWAESWWWTRHWDSYSQGCYHNLGGVIMSHHFLWRPGGHC